MNNYRYILEDGSKKYRCPGCGKKRFVRYVDRETGEYMPGQYGRCDREINCGYFLNPYEDGFAKNQIESDWQKPEPQPASFISPNLLKASLKGYDSNNFVQFLKTLFYRATVNDLIRQYHIGTSKYWDGATVFWQVDENRRIRSGKIMLYQPDGHRKRDTDYNYITWVHSILENKKFNLEQCLFGAHLISNHPDKPIAIVESEKTAIISSVYFPEYTWLATGALHNLKSSTCEILSGHEVVLYPDLNAYQKWLKKAVQLSDICNVSVSNYLQSVSDTNEKEAGFDLADFLTRFNVGDFRANNGNHYHVRESGKPLESKYESQIPPVKLNSEGYPASWDEISVEPGTQEAAQAKRYALNDCDTEFERLKILDPKVALIAELFDGEPITEIELS